jgi:NTP pyrophosphatase (non-canonical NTP hydrolase)
MTNWNKLAAEHHAAMVEKGFHEKYSHTDLLLRGIEEVGEASKAWRKNRRANMAKFYMALQSGEEFTRTYNDVIKGCIEEELADIALIMMDFAATNGHEIEVIGIVLGRKIEDVLMEIAHFICRICNFSDEPDSTDVKNIGIYIKYIFGNLESLAEEFGIDLEEQVKLKMQYNATREYRHGDKN